MFQLSFFSAMRFPWALRSILSTCHSWSQGKAQKARSETKTSTSLAGFQHNQSLHAWNDRVRLYREQLMSGQWHHANEHEHGARSDYRKIRCTTTIIFGLRDQALDSRIAVDGIEAFIEPQTGHAKGRIYLLEDVGHWSPLNSRCNQIIQRAISSSTHS